LDRQYHTLDKASLLECSLSRYGNEENFMSEMRKIREKIIDHISSHPDYPNLGLKVQSYQEKDAPERSIYKDEFCDRHLVSLDLVKANFQSFLTLGKSIVNSKDTYEDFISDFTDDKYFASSKKIRQVIFGNLNPKRQQMVTKGIMFGIKSKLDWYSSKPLTVSADELIFDIYSCEELQLLKDFVSKLPEKIKIRDFRIEKLASKSSTMYVKRYTDGSFELKCCPGPYTIEALRQVYNEPVHPYDRVFFNDGRVCEYKDSLF
jgi:hypothetical protein